VRAPTTGAAVMVRVERTYFLFSSQLQSLMD
jgi:hypothetical protein